jgi:hypothetical protein
MDDPKLFIGVCNSQEYMPSAFHWSWEKTIKPYEYVKVRFDHSDDVVRNNSMIAEFLESDCDIMVKMDIDQEYPLHFFSALVPHLEVYKIIGPLIHNKWRWADYRALMFETSDFPYLAESMTDYSGVTEVEYAHTNLLYSREVLESIEPPWYKVYHTSNGTSRSKDLDFTFLEKIKEKGYKFYIDSTVEVKHLVLEGVDSELHSRWNR